MSVKYKNNSYPSVTYNNKNVPEVILALYNTASVAVDLKLNKKDSSCKKNLLRTLYM